MPQFPLLPFHLGSDPTASHPAGALLPGWEGNGRWQGLPCVPVYLVRQWSLCPWVLVRAREEEEEEADEAKEPLQRAAALGCNSRKSGTEGRGSGLGPNADSRDESSTRGLSVRKSIRRQKCAQSSQRSSMQRHTQTRCTPSFKQQSNRAAPGPCNCTAVDIGMLQPAGSDAQVRTGRPSHPGPTPPQSHCHQRQGFSEAAVPQKIERRHINSKDNSR